MFDLGRENKIVRFSVLGGGAGVGILLLMLKLVIGVEGEPTRDLASEVGVHVLTGGVSTAGLLVWGAAAGAAAMAGLVLWRQARREEALFLLITAVGIGYLGMDDAFLLHEDVIPNHLRFQEHVTFLVLGVAGAAWVIGFRSMILATDVLLLGLVAFAGGLAMIVDVLDLWSTAGEDWLKYIGLIALAGWVVDASLRFLASTPEDEASGKDVSAPRPTRAPGGGTPPPAR